MAICLPRTSRTSRGESFSTSRPPKRISPETIFPGGSGINRISERFATDLPEPDSPTMPSVSPRFNSKLMPSTAFTTPSSVSKYVRRSLTSRRFPSVCCSIDFSLCLLRPGLSLNPTHNHRLKSVLLPHLRIERVTQAIAKKVQRKQHQRHRHSRENQLPRKDRQRLGAVRRQTPPRHARRTHTETEERKKRFTQHYSWNRQRCVHDHRPERVRNQMADDDLWCRNARSPRGQNKILILQGHDLATNYPRHRQPRHRAQRNEQFRQLTCRGFRGQQCKQDNHDDHVR